jgi:hypothetical protein
MEALIAFEASGNDVQHLLHTAVDRLLGKKKNIPDQLQDSCQFVQELYLAASRNKISKEGVIFER